MDENIVFDHQSRVESEARSTLEELLREGERKMLPGHDNSVANLVENLCVHKSYFSLLRESEFDTSIRIRLGLLHRRFV